MVGEEWGRAGRDSLAFDFTDRRLSEDIEVPEEVEERRGIVEETKWLEKARGRVAFSRFLERVCTSLRSGNSGSTFLHEPRCVRLWLGFPAVAEGSRCHLVHL